MLAASAFVLSMWLYRHRPALLSRLLSYLPHRNAAQISS
jgi:hypothetical protein